MEETTCDRVAMSTATDDHQSVCPVELAGALDNPIRRWLQQPDKLMKPYIKPGMTVLDMGCGPGFFTIEIARMLKGSGKVIAADLQQGMLDKVAQKIQGTELEPFVKLHRCKEKQIGLTEKVDFILAFYMVHEVPDKPRLFEELRGLLQPNGTLLIVEPKFHVTKKNFTQMLSVTEKSGLQPIGTPSFSFSRAVLLKQTY
jgi:Methylase involved in ubiquinone/menaquinone biosynthesis